MKRITRIITLLDASESSMLVLTDAPRDTIKDAIKFRDDQLCSGINFGTSEFEIIAGYIQKKGYTFDELAISDESYMW